ncbi:MAG: SIR2 family protein [Cytophagales bacterium]|nr:SIR2 family protein [Cytophagales bacterium]
MFNVNDEKYLLRAIGRNEVILFLGAGFANDAKNYLNENIPIGSQLAKKIWHLLDYPGDYNGDPLPLMYQVLLKKGIKKVIISNFLNENFLVEEIPDSYNALIEAFWYRIYTTNIDDLVDRVYKKSKNQRLDILVYPDDEPKERDQFLDRQQIIYMHGKLPCDPEHVIFSTQQYARGSIEHQPFYEQFVREYSTHPTVFIGSQLDEPLFWQYIESRRSRDITGSELRPKSFIIVPHISEPKKQALKEYNIVPVEAYTKDFLNWLKLNSTSLPNKEQIILASHPDLEQLIVTKGYELNKRHINDFSTSFKKVHKHKKITSPNRSNFLLGFAPTWSDIYNDYDAPRNLSAKIIDDINHTFENKSESKILAITGSAGCGKSTILRRIGVALSQLGRTVYFTNSQKLPSPQILSQVLTIFDERVLLLFDNAEIVLNYLPGLIKETENINNPPIVLIASRTNDFDRLTGKSKAILDLVEYGVPRLERNEIIDLIQKLDNNGLLGYLQGLTPRQRIKEFEGRAKKQLLVAMREATFGRGFDEILKDEFETIEPTEGKVICACVAITSHLGYFLTNEEIITISNLKPGDTLNVLNRNLQGIVISDEVGSKFLQLRHRTIADYLVEKSINRPLLKESYIRLLDSFANIIRGKKYHSREFKLYRELINHTTIYHRFNQKIEVAREIYESIKDRLSYDFHFWLQYGSLELEGGDLNYSENYLAQADSLRKDDNYVLTAMGHLLFKKGVQADNLTQAMKFRKEGDKILYNLIQHFGYQDPYYYHIFCYQSYNWVKLWITDDEDKKKELIDILDICKVGCSAHPKNQRLDAIREVVERALYYLGIEPQRRPPDPEIVIEI